MGRPLGALGFLIVPRVTEMQALGRHLFRQVSTKYCSPKHAIDVAVVKEEDWIESRCLVLSHVAV